jgi:hypothetical protein
MICAVRDKQVHFRGPIQDTRNVCEGLRKGNTADVSFEYNF